MADNTDSDLDLDQVGSDEANRSFLFCSDGQMDGPLHYQYHLYTVCAIAVKCHHNSIAVSSLHSPSKAAGLWLPYVAVRECFKYTKMAALLTEFFYKELNIPCDRNKLMEDGSLLLFEKVMLHSIYRIQIPDGEFITRIIYLARWRGSDKNCCRNTNNIKWVPLNLIYDFANGILQPRTDETFLSLNRFWGSEVISYASNLKITKFSSGNQLMQVNEQTSAEVFKYVQRKTGDAKQKPKNKTLDLFSQFLADAHFGEMDAVKIYSDFVQHCYPSINMSFVSFNDYCQRIGLASYLDERISLKNVFKAMNYKVKNYIGFNELLIGLASIDINSPHSEARYIYIFRFYDSDSDGFLDRDDVRRLLNDVHLMNQSLELEPVETMLAKMFATEKKMNYEQFVTEINSQRLKGTNNLCRTTKPILQIINEINAYEMIIQKNVAPFGQKIVSSCPKCRPKYYSLATHSVKLTKTGRIEEPKLLNVVDLQDGCIDQETIKSKAMLRKHSIEYIFKQTSNSNYVLGLIRKMAGYCKMTEDKKKEVRNQVVNGLSVNCLRMLCEEVSEILSVEPRVIKVSTPTFVLGDIHGNINDLLIFEEQLWPMAPSANAPSVLFLGDYVDRGEFGIEVVSYLFAMKTLAPNKFFLLRGNHEVRAIQRSFTFEKECLEKYGSNGNLVFETLNRVFDMLPFCALIDESIYCAHGGIPFTQTKIEDLMRAPAVLQDPEQEAPAVWEILWSDPITNNEFHELTEFMKKRDDCGYMSNMKRSTAFYFAEIATVNFLKKNNLTHVLRAHEVINEGFKFNHRGMVITIFSSSRYCGGQNKAAAIMVEAFESDGFIKIISLDT